MITLILCGILALPFILAGGLVAVFKSRKRGHILKLTAAVYGISVVVLIFGVGPFVMARFVADAGSRPMDANLSETPGEWKIPFIEISFLAKDGVRLSGWFVAPRGRHTVVIYSHGLFRSRHEVLDRAMKLCRLGYGALLYDARHHGLSDKAVVSLGYFERFDVLGALYWLRRQPETANSKVVLMGVSMGAAAVLMAAAETHDYDALILDSPFQNLEETVTHHAWLFLKLPKYPFVPLFLHYYRQRVHFDWRQFDVGVAASRILPCPVLMIHGGKDERIPVAHGRRIFEILPGKDKQFFVVENATHGAGYRTAPDAYMAQVTDFLRKNIE
jgi:pimeloyl-ACP methyl ester carboxylesterase